MVKPLRIWSVSDTHCDYADMPPADADIILHAGDITNYGSKQNEDFAAKTYLKRLADIAPVFWIPGNHDLGMARLQIKSQKFPIVNVLRDLIELPNGLTIVGASMSPCYNLPQLGLKWDNMTSNSRAEDVYYRTLPNADIVLSHCPPASETGHCTSSGQLGSAGLLEYIEKHQPSLVVCGHIHEPIKRVEQIGKTTVCNVATQPALVSYELRANIRQLYS